MGVFKSDSNVRRPTLESHERSDSNQRQWCDSSSSPPPRLTLFELLTISAAFRTIYLQTHAQDCECNIAQSPQRCTHHVLGEARFELWPRFVWVEIQSLFVLFFFLCACFRKINVKYMFMCLKLENQTFLSSCCCAVCFTWDKHYFQSVVAKTFFNRPANVANVQIMQFVLNCKTHWFLY